MEVVFPRLCQERSLKHSLVVMEGRLFVVLLHLNWRGENENRKFMFTQYIHVHVVVELHVHGVCKYYFCWQNRNLCTLSGLLALHTCCNER